MMHKAWSSIEELPYCFSRSSVNFQGHIALKIVEFDPNWAFPDCNSSLNAPMAMKCCTKLETAKKRCPIVFQGHPSDFKVTGDKTSPILTQIRHFRTIGRSQLSNPSDLPCSRYRIQVLELMQMHPKERLGRVILTASWFNDINIGYRFHTSTVCHSCCNNVTYISEENLDISGSAWKKCHADMAFLLARIVLVLKLYKARAVFDPCKHQQPDCGPVLAYYLWHILIFVLYRYESNKCI